MPTTSNYGLHWGCNIQTTGPKTPTGPQAGNAQQDTAVVSGPGMPNGAVLSSAQLDPCFGMKQRPCDPAPTPDLSS